MPRDSIRTLLKRRQLLIESVNRGYPDLMRRMALQHRVRVRSRHKEGIDAEGNPHIKLTPTTLNSRQHGAYELRAALGDTPLRARGRLMCSYRVSSVGSHQFECSYAPTARPDSNLTNRQLAELHAHGKRIRVTKRARRHLAAEHRIYFSKDKKSVYIPPRMSSGFDQEENDRMLAMVNHEHLKPLWR